MITLPNEPYPNGARPRLMDFGFEQRPPTGGALTRVNRLGTRYAVDFSYPLMKADVAAPIVASLMAGRGDLVRVEYPTQRTQPGGGTPLVDGNDSAGFTLKVKTLSFVNAPLVGYWLHVQNTAGRRSLHTVTAVGAPYNVNFPALTCSRVLTVWPAIRTPLVDGNSVELVTPTVEGLVTGDFEWNIMLGDFVQVSFTLEETE